MMKKTDQGLTVALGLMGAAVGGCIGYFAFFWIVRQGFYALIVPPGLLGFGAGLCARRRSVPLALICGFAGLALGLFTEWRYAPFGSNESLSYFLSHLQALTPVTLIMLGIGTVLSYRLALGFDRPPPAVS